jgi:hypothetical protein
MSFFFIEVRSTVLYLCGVTCVLQLEADTEQHPHQLLSASAAWSFGGAVSPSGKEVNTCTEGYNGTAVDHYSGLTPQVPWHALQYWSYYWTVEEVSV